ncbi:MAG: glycoside hydrolase 5 family protein, partial [Candidatus Kryptoniota bacterium]
MCNLLLFSPLVFFALVFEACSTFLFWQKPNYVEVDGIQFVYERKPYYYIGANMWDGCCLGASGRFGDRPRLIRELDDLRSIGITNLRILGASEYSYIENSLKPAIQLKPGVYDENLLEGLDFLLAEMDKRDMHSVIFLNNYWDWSGGMAQYADWANGGGGVDPVNGNDAAFMDYSASFYGNEKAKKLFFNYLMCTLERKNKYDGYYYYEKPAIMAWELANEPRPGRDKKYLADYYRWIDTTAHFIHSVDRNHLVTTGS